MVGENLKPGHKVKIIDFRVDTTRGFGWGSTMREEIGLVGKVHSPHERNGVKGYLVRIISSGNFFFFACSNLKDLEVKK